MLLSANNAKTSSAFNGERRESAPPGSRNIVYSPLTSPVTEANQTKQRPRSNSHVQLSLHPQASYHRPLPALPTHAIPAASSADKIKVLVEENSPQSSLPSPLGNSGRLHPNSYISHPQSPQQLTHNLTNHSHYHQTPGSKAQLDYQSSTGSNGSNNDHRASPSGLRQPSNLRGEIHPFDSSQIHEQQNGRGSGSGQNYGQSYVDGGTSQRQQHTASPSQSSLTPSERSLQKHHLNNLLQDDSSKSANNIPLGTPPSSYNGSHQLSPRSQNYDTPSSSSSSSAMDYNPFSSPLLYPDYITQLPNNSTNYQSYLPPPVSLNNNQHHHRQGYATDKEQPTEAQSINRSVIDRTASHLMAATRPSTLSAHRDSRRHSYDARSLAIKTQHFQTLKGGPRTADSSVGGRRYWEQDNSQNGNDGSRNRSKPNIPNSKHLLPSSSSHLLPRQSPNHLSIPQTSQRPGNSQQNYQNQHESTLQQQNGKRHLNYQQNAHQMPSTIKSPKSPRPTSPLSPRPYDTPQDRTAMTLMQQYLTHPDDPDSEADIAMQILISQAAVDSKGFEVLVPQTVESIKRHHATLSSRIAALTARLSLESKIREAAQSLLKLHADNKKLARQASEHLEAANRKVDHVATELWKLTQLASDLQRTLLQHTSGVLALGVVRLEDQSRRERESHAIQLEDARVGQDIEDQFQSMAKVIMSLESDALEAQSLLEDKDHAIERLMRQLEHQRDLFAKLDEQQQRTMAFSRSQQKCLDLLGDGNDTKVSELNKFLGTVQTQLQRILQQQQKPQSSRRNQNSEDHSADSDIDNDSRSSSKKGRLAQLWSSESTLISKHSTQRQDSISSAPSDGNAASTIVASDTPSSSKPTSLAKITSPHFSLEAIQSTLDALESNVTESQQKINVLEGELGLLRRQSAVLSASRNNSIKIKDFSVPRSQVDETIRSALEKSLKDALLAKEMAQQELENERQRWQEDQDHRISALEESLVAVEDMDKSGTNESQPQDEAIKDLRRQLREAIDEIDVLSQQQQSSLKYMRQLFDLIPDHRRKSQMQLYSAHQQLQQKIATSPSDSSGNVLSTGHKQSLSGSSSSLSSAGTVSFSMDTLIVRVKELVGRFQQLEQDNEALRQHVGKSIVRSHHASSEDLSTHEDGSRSDSDQDHSTWILKSDLERLQANAGMTELLEKELDLLKQHTDVLLDENARLADMAAASVTGSPAPNRSSAFGGIIQKPTRDEALDELQEIIRVKDKLLRERDQLVQEQGKSLQLAHEEIEKIKGAAGVDDGPRSTSPQLSSFDILSMEDLRVKSCKLEEEASEMRMIIAALEGMSGGSGTGSQLLNSLSVSSDVQSPPQTPWLSPSLGALNSLSSGSLALRQSFDVPSGASSPVPSAIDHFNGGSINALSPGGSNSSSMVAGATAALRKEFRRAMAELRDEKDKAVRKEVEERRRVEREVRRLRRELQTMQINKDPSNP
ncbi:hypothetical protein BGZ49_009378 [Haplosporangium sp. Z 27]|nr:hypothetical protein BGZ49_009378 [Haplosporangium sp. Z 27]